MALSTGGRCRTYGVYLQCTDELCTNQHTLHGDDADSAGTLEFSCTNANYVLSGVVLTGNHLYKYSLFD